MTCSIALKPKYRYGGKWPKVGKSAIVTGASSGLGRELAILFSQDGHVILSGRNATELQRTRELCKDPANTTPVCGNLRDIETIRRLASFADLYAIRYLICSAGEYLNGSFLSSKPEQIENILQSNFVSTIKLIRTVYPHLLDVDSVIVHINSIAGKRVDASEMVYAATKHGMTAFLQGLRWEARHKDIRVLDVFPGAINTPMAIGKREWSDKLIDAKEAAWTIYTVATMPLATLQIEELHIGRWLHK